MALFSLWHDTAFRSFLIINLASIVEKADEALLPSVYKEVGAEFKTTPSGLGTLTFVRAATQALCYPLAAYLSLRYNRLSVICAGALIWGLATSAVALAGAYSEVIVARAINGLGLALVIPAIQSLVADSSTAEARGTAFGWLALTANLGAIGGGCFGVLLGGSEPFGMSGWRTAFHSVALITYFTAFCVWKYGAEPESSERKERDSRLHEIGWESDFWRLWSGVRTVMVVPTFQLLVLQGALGSFPWAALSFSAMWLELIGFSHAMTAFLLSSFAIGCCMGSLVGGWVGDKLAGCYPDSGRIICAQFSSGMAVPLSLILLWWLPPHPDLALLYSALLTLLGFLVSWNGSSTNNPILSEIVPENLRTSIYALDRMLEMSIAAFAPPIVGILTEGFFGYVPVTANEATIDSEIQAFEDSTNARALSRGLLATVAIPFTLCCFTYTFLYWTYPKDRDLASARMKRGETGHVKLHHVASSGDEEQEALALKFGSRDTVDVGEGCGAV